MLNKNDKLSVMVKIAILSVVSYLIMYLEFPLGFFPEFLKMDFSDIPAIIGGFALGPVAGVLIEFMKNFIHLLTKTSTAGIGELANFLIGGSFVFVSSSIYHLNKTRKNAIIGSIVATIAMSIVGGICNYYVLLPFYSTIMPIDTIIDMASKLNNHVVDLKTLVYYSVVPFNFIKGITMSIITMSIYKKVAPILKK